MCSAAGPRVIGQVVVFCLQKNGCGSPVPDCRSILFFLNISDGCTPLQSPVKKAADCPLAAKPFPDAGADRPLASGIIFFFQNVESILQNVPAAGIFPDSCSRSRSGNAWLISLWACVSRDRPHCPSRQPLSLPLRKRTQRPTRLPWNPHRS